MQTLLQVLSEEERHQVHERTLRVLAKSGVRVDTAEGRELLAGAGAEVDENASIVRFPRALVEESLRVATKQFSLGARRPGWSLEMNGGECTLLADGEAVFALDSETGRRRAGTTQDMVNGTRLIDALDEVGLWWAMVEAGDRDDTLANAVAYQRNVHRNFSKHVQDAPSSPEQTRWFLEVVQILFGDKETIRRAHPVSFLLCPQSPLMIDGEHTDAYLATVGYDIPVAVMPMPLMGGTAPASLASTTVIGNCEVLAMLCLVQAAAPGTPFIYAPVLAVMDPRSGRLSAGAIESALMGAASTEMARYYGLPVEASGGGTDHHVPGIQGGYERAMGALLPVLSWPDILVGPGCLGGSMVFSPEQLIIDVEVYRMSRQAYRGIATAGDNWLDDVLEEIQPGDHFIDKISTVRAIRGGEWYVSQLGVHDAYDAWEDAGRPTLLEEAREKVKEILATHQPLPLDDEVEREFDRLQKRAEAIA
ncbi:trimethylamine methyltransferase family protein [Chloroflexota bacterium]